VTSRHHHDSSHPLMRSPRSILPALAIAAAVSLASCEKSPPPSSSAEDLKPLILAVESAADEFDKLWTKAKQADVTADLRTLSQHPTMPPPLQKAERENRIAEDARKKLDELSSALEEKLQIHADRAEAIAFSKRVAIRKKIEALTTALVTATDHTSILEDLREARTELDALRPKFGNTGP
jgi:hypothetical protein